ncbi:cytochrome ubiquinol oxidase subunit I [Mediterranea massiliensis]|uniref:cytochrome ubiquinol oxidase subunit I n=1 Tax=Mediterranea massiliensis TaxID=1841865 RepID=UPI0025A40A2D|nr:cytochrome ubiquinol oxidase subunit I [Mediterranea massiliensis]MDM8337366.1 cytochrome ubiquinol oxidase subunit I [Mediterranea massiliensis]
MFENIDTSLIDWSRAQFALTAIYHWIFVPLTLGLAVIMGIMETIYYRTGNEFWKRTAQFWMRLFGINFAIGVATGLILEFEFGTNWSNYSWFVGDIFGAPLAIEGILAFFMEATFIAVMFFGWEKVSRRFHLASTWLTGLGATISAWWILVANAWMQNPVGMVFNPDTARNEMVDFWAVATSPMAVNKFFHSILSGWVLGAIFVVGVSCWYLLRRRHKDFALASIKIGACVGLFASLMSAWTGDGSGYQVAQNQPMKLAAMEGYYEGQEGAGLVAFGILNPGKQTVDDGVDPFLMRIELPKMLSLLAERDSKAFVPGINDLLKGGYQLKDGSLALSAEEKMARGRKAIAAFAAYRTAKAEGNEEAAVEAASVLTDNVQYFGYGYVKDANELVPNVPLTFYMFRVMVMLGGYFILFFMVVLSFVYKKNLAEMRWMHWIALFTIPLGYLAGQAGWVVAECGRQPWAIQDMLPTSAAISRLEVGSVQTTFFIFLVLFTVLLIAEVGIMLKAIRKGF